MAENIYSLKATVVIEATRNKGMYPYCDDFSGTVLNVTYDLQNSTRGELLNLLRTMITSIGDDDESTKER